MWDSLEKKGGFICSTHTQKAKHRDYSIVNCNGTSSNTLVVANTATTTGKFYYTATEWLKDRKNNASVLHLDYYHSHCTMLLLLGLIYSDTLTGHPYQNFDLVCCG